MKSFFTSLATISRNVYVNNKSSYELTGNSYKGYLKPVDEVSIIEDGKFGKMFNFTTGKNANIEESDILEISGEKYKVKGIAPWAGRIIKYKKLSLIKIG